MPRPAKRKAENLKFPQKTKNKNDRRQRSVRAGQATEARRGERAKREASGAVRRAARFHSQDGRGTEGAPAWPRH